MVVATDANRLAVHRNMHVTHCHFGDSSKLESGSDLQNPPTRGTLEDRSSAESPNGSVPSYFKTWKRRCGAQWDNLRLQATSSRLYMSARSAPGV